MHECNEKYEMHSCAFSFKLRNPANSAEVLKTHNR